MSKLPGPRGGGLSGGGSLLGGGGPPLLARMLPGKTPEASISLNCSILISSLLSGTRYFFSSTKAKETLACASGAGANAATSTCNSSVR